jgi:hypothetical protein
MMNALSKNELKTLIRYQNDPCLSIFLPTHRRAGPDIQQDPLRLKNLLHQAQDLLLARIPESTQVEAFLKPIAALLTNRPIWEHPNEGLAVLRSPDLFRCYQLPFIFKEQIIVSQHFYLKPLLPVLTADRYFYILALSQNEVRLLQATHFGVTEIPLPESVPTSMASAIKYDQPEPMVESHSSASTTTRGKGGRRPMIFHGQGAAGPANEKQILLHYFQQIDRGLHELLRDETAPLVLAGVEFLLPIYHEANTYPHLLPEGVLGNPERLKGRDEILREQAWPIVESSVLKERQDALAQFEEYQDTDRTSSNVSALVPAACYGQIESLFVALNQEQWGTFNPTTYTLDLHETAVPGDEDLLDLAARETILHGGAVYALEQDHMPDKALLAAVYRSLRS